MKPRLISLQFCGTYFQTIFPHFKLQPLLILKHTKSSEENKRDQRNPYKYFHLPKLHTYWLIIYKTNHKHLRVSGTLQAFRYRTQRAPTIKTERLDLVVVLPVLSNTNVVQVPGGRQNGGETCPSHFQKLLIQLVVYPNVHHCVSFQLQQAHDSMDDF